MGSSDLLTAVELLAILGPIAAGPDWACALLRGGRSCGCPGWARAGLASPQPTRPPWGRVGRFATGHEMGGRAHRRPWAWATASPQATGLQQ